MKREIGAAPVFATVIAGYLAVTIAESVLAPLFPVVGAQLGLEVAHAGLAFGLLTGAIAVGNLVGGAALARAGPRPALVAALLLTAIGAAAAAIAPTGVTFVAAQSVIGLGVGVFFAPGIDTMGRTAREGRRGLAMGLFGVAFSAGLAVAAGLAAVSSEVGWRGAFWVSALACMAGAGVTLLAPLPGPAPQQPKDGGRGALTLPVVVGTVGTVSQYGTVAFMALFIVQEWAMSPAVAATVIAVARLLSVPGKLAVGASADRWGTGPTLRAMSVLLLLSGVAWTTLPVPAAAVPAAVVFAASVSGLFPIANLLAVERLGDRGGLLGTYRSVQIAIGALAATVMGVLSAGTGLGVTLLATALLPGLLLFVPPARRPVAVT